MEPGVTGTDDGDAVGLGAGGVAADPTGTEGR